MREEGFTYDEMAQAVGVAPTSVGTLLARALRRFAAGFRVAVATLDPPAERLVVEPSWRQPRGGAGQRSGFFAMARGALLRAAVVVLAVGGVAWGALPGSPVRGWIEQAWSEGISWVGRGAPGGAAAEDTGAGQGGPATSGLSILPVDGRAHLLLKGASQATRLRIRLVDSAQLTVQWSGAEADLYFRTAPGRIEVLGGGEGELLVEAPRGARTVIEVDGQVHAVAEGGVLRSLVPTAESADDDVVFQSLKPGG
jgi:hypothetical protein